MITPVSVHVVAVAVFPAVNAWLERREFDWADDPATADLVLVLLDHPDRFAPTEVERLIASAPLARWVVCVSTWCESIGRNRDAWPRGVIVPARLAVRRLEAELAVLRGDRSPLPLTASRDEAWAFDHADDSEASLDGVRVRIVSPDRRLAETWAAILREAGGEVVVDPRSSCNVVLFDGDPWDEATRARLGELGEVPVVVARTMPTDADAVPKLASIAVLIDALRGASHQLAGTPSCPPDAS